MLASFFIQSKNRITANGAALLGRSLQNCKSKSLTRLVIGEQDLTNGGSGHGGLLTLASGLNSLHFVSLVGCSIYADGARVLCPMVHNNLMHLNLSMNFLTDRGAAQLSSQLRNSLRLAVLKLRGCFIHDDGFGALVDVIFGEWRLRKSQLKYLDLTGNRISDKGIQHLNAVCADSIPHGVAADEPFSVNEVRLCDNAITFAGAKALGAALAQCSHRTSTLGSTHDETGNPILGGGKPFIEFLAFESELDLSGMNGRLDVCHLLESRNVVAEVSARLSSLLGSF